MRIRAVIGWVAVGLCTLGSGPCPACYDDECGPKGETYCRDGVAYYCGEPNDNGAYVLLTEDCAAQGRVCVVVAEAEEADVPGPVAVCLPGCEDDCGCAEGVCVEGACQAGTRDPAVCCAEGDAGPAVVPCPTPCEDTCGCPADQVCTDGRCVAGERPAELCCGPEC